MRRTAARAHDHTLRPLARRRASLRRLPFTRNLPAACTSRGRRRTLLLADDEQQVDSLLSRLGEPLRRRAWPQRFPASQAPRPGVALSSRGPM
jgi:hypothetical protein